MKKNLFIIVLLFLFVISTLFANRIIEQQNAPRNSDAIIGGKLETGYPFAMYLVSYFENNRVNICGSTLISPKVSITAGHCVLNPQSIQAGLNQFDINSTNKLTVGQFLIHPSWNKNTGTSNQNAQSDIAILKFENEVSLPQFAEITAPQIGCGYEVVGYGRSEESLASGSFVRARKSAELCIEEIDNLTFLVKGVDGGVCHGDSGSPIFIKGTNKLVGLMSAGETDSKGNCFVTNLGIAVNLSRFSNFISANLTNQNSNVNQNNIACGELDVNGDNFVSIVDFFYFSKNYNLSCKNDKTINRCGGRDFNQDSIINFADFNNLLSKYGKDCI